MLVFRKMSKKKLRLLLKINKTSVKDLLLL